ncbi:nucleotidyltransferase domain-containing protein [bacterium]|nr:nucleotidyltransferase domain-containing protein [bacterium]RIK74761.1 MAG: nucleotidyltransferase domain-containing protein [candidate division KSB1 bacterium]
MRPEISIICETWVRAVHPQKIILFGSHATGDAGRESDLDFLVIWENALMPSNRQKSIHLRRLLPRNVHVPIDLIVMTPEQYQEATTDTRTFTSQISRQGKVLYESLS